MKIWNSNWSSSVKNWFKHSLSTSANLRPKTLHLHKIWKSKSYSWFAVGRILHRVEDVIPLLHWRGDATMKSYCEARASWVLCDISLNDASLWSLLPNSLPWNVTLDDRYLLPKAVPKPHPRPTPIPQPPPLKQKSIT